jgi:arsenite/tail-anchored protein-transporting ATPase
MIEPLLTRLSSPIIVVTGKGGVGKTTTAGAIALAFADRGQRTHLISTDPAHSLADLFESTAESPCSDLLAVEEFDARAYAETLFARIQPGLTALIERGTYLDESDARSFLDLSVPGIDEVMAALRLVELLRDGNTKIVVDTAPTGHTLRLLESPRILRSWVAAGRAMADKAAAVAEQLLRQRVRFPAEDILDEIERDAAAFESDVLRSGAFVVATRQGTVVESETAGLVKALRSIGAQVVATITDRVIAKSERVWVAPQLDPATGCVALREWAAHLGDNTMKLEPAPRVSVAHGNAASRIAATRARYIWAAGKGGVGKSTCASAIATLLAESRSVCLVSTDPAGSLAEVLGHDVSRAGTAINANLTARQIDASAEFAQMRTAYHDSVEHLFESLGLEQSARLDRRVVETLFDFAPPGIDEIIALIEIMEHAGEYDVTVIDSAPTGHFLRLLEMPEIALEWVHALLRLLVKYHATASLDSLGHDLLAFSKRLRQLKLDLSAVSMTEVFVVTHAEPLVIAETVRLCTRLRDAQIPIAAVIVNQADAGRAHAMRTNFPSAELICAPDAGGEVLGPPALRAFLAQWEYIGE